MPCKWQFTGWNDIIYLFIFLPQHVELVKWGNNEKRVPTSYSVLYVYIDVLNITVFKNAIVQKQHSIYTLHTFLYIFGC